MNKNFLFVLFFFCNAVLKSQSCWNSMYPHQFEANNCLDLKIDHSNYPGNIWQIGTPQKTAFTSAYSQSLAIVTHTANSYPSKNTSVFIIKHTAGAGFVAPHTAALSGQYYVDTDGADYGKIEFSPNNGSTWVDLVNPGVYAGYINGGPKPILTGNSNGWKYFGFFISPLGPLFNIQYGDTVLFRFSFISDPVETYKDGLMYDDLQLWDYIEGIREHRSIREFISLFPNPVKDKVQINTIVAICDNDLEIRLSSVQGQLLASKKITSEKQEIDLSSLSRGIYFVQLYNKGKLVGVEKVIRE